MPTLRLIKKYPNRRLYDTKESRYITLEEVRQMVLHETPIKVIDRQNDENITRNILLQIVMEQESNGEPLLSAEVLARFIRGSGETAQPCFSAYLDASLRFFTKQQEAVRAQAGQVPEGTPMDDWTKLGEQNMKLWQDMFEGRKGSKKDS